MPTLASIANIDPPKNIDGINVWPSILGKKSIPDERFLYWEFYEGRFGQAVRWKNWKAVKNDIDLPWELYDLSVDESETKDISATNQDVLNIIKDWVNENRVESPYWSSGLE
jgi:arylsulfatase A-like enzyme